MGFADSDKKLVPACITPSGTRTSQQYKCNNNHHSWENIKCALCFSLTGKSAFTGAEKYTQYLLQASEKLAIFPENRDTVGRDSTAWPCVPWSRESQGMLLRQEALHSLEGQLLSEVAQGAEPATHPIEINDNPFTFMGLTCHCCHCPVATHFILPSPCLSCTHPLMPPRENKVAGICRLKLCARNLDI